LVWSASLNLPSLPARPNGVRLILSQDFLIFCRSANFNGTVNTLPADATSGVPAWLIGQLSVFGLDSGYTSGSAIVSSATYNGKTLASLGFTTTGQIGEWTLQPADPGDPYTAFDKINVVLVPPTPPPSAVPGPLPLLGVSAAFGLSRRLRRRVARHPSHQPKA
jgi:hypothetical protein